MPVKLPLPVRSGKKVRIVRPDPIKSCYKSRTERHGKKKYNIYKGGVNAGGVLFPGERNKAETYSAAQAVPDSQSMGTFNGRL